MALLDDIRLSLRVATDAYDGEVSDLVAAALRDMERAGVDPSLLAVDEGGDIPDKYVKHAVRCYAKAHFGFDNPEAERLDESYQRIVRDLLNSSANVAAAGRAAAEAGEPDGSDGSGEPDGAEGGEG